MVVVVYLLRFVFTWIWMLLLLYVITNRRYFVDFLWMENFILRFTCAMHVEFCLDSNIKVMHGTPVTTLSAFVNMVLYPLGSFSTNCLWTIFSHDLLSLNQTVYDVGDFFFLKSESAEARLVLQYFTKRRKYTDNSLWIGFRGGLLLLQEIHHLSLSQNMLKKVMLEKKIHPLCGIVWKD